MRLGLECFRIERLSPVKRIAQIFCLMLQVRIGTVFSKHKFLPRILFFQAFYPRFYILYLLFIPSEVTIHALYIGILINGMFCRAVSVYCYRKTIRVFGLSQVMKCLSEPCGIVCRSIHLIMQSPNIDRRMIEVLTNQLAQLRLRVFGFVTGYTVYKRNFRPYHQSQ